MMRRTFVELFIFAMVSLATALAAAQPAVERLERRLREEGGADQAGYLGVVADDRMTNGSGVELLEVVAGGPADKGGLERGDLVTKVDSKPVRTLIDFAAALQDLPVGAKIRFTLERQGKPKLAEVTLGTRPPAAARRFPNFGRLDDGQPPRMSLLGVRVEPVDPDSPAAGDLPAPQGAYVVRVAEGSPAAQAGIPLHAVIVAVDGKDVAGPADLKEIIAGTRPGQEIKISFYTRGKLLERSVRLAELMPEGLRAPDEPAAEAPERAAGDFGDRERIEQLEERVRRLEARLAELERLLEK
jgi:S1-C subfamily serine protease